jgi:hypothetical protein
MLRPGFGCGWSLLALACEEFNWTGNLNLTQLTTLPPPIGVLRDSNDGPFLSAML